MMTNSGHLNRGSSMNQKEAVFLAVCAVKQASSFEGAVELSDAELKNVREFVVLSFLAGDVELKEAEKRDETYIRKYVPGLVNNWLRKDKRLNGDVDYVAKNPGSRQGVGDEMLRNMKALLAITTDPEDKKVISAEIEKRKAQLEEAKKPKLDIAKLPEHLRKFAPQGS